MELRADINLQHLAMISYSKWIWSREIRDPVYETEGFFLKKEFRNELEKRKVLSHSVDKLLYIIKAMGKTMFDWISFESGTHVFAEKTNVTGMHSKQVAFTDKANNALYWNNDGTINECKMVERKWLNGAGMNEIQVCMSYYMACACVLVEYINFNWRDILRFCRSRLKKEFFGTFNNTEPKIRYIVSSILFLAVPDIEESLSAEERVLYNEYINHPAHSQVVNMFLMSVNLGCDVAVNYYWKLMNDEEKQTHLVSSALIAVSLYGRKKNVPPIDRRKINYAKIFQFLLMEMTEDQRKEFFSIETFKESNATLTDMLGIFVQNWFLEGFFFQAFDIVKGMYECIATDRETIIGSYYGLLKCIIRELHADHVFGLDVKTTPHYKMFWTVWDELDATQFSKGSIFLSSKEFSLDQCLLYLKTLYKIFDIEILNAFLNRFKWSKENRILFLTSGKGKFRDLIEEDQYELLEEFMAIVLKSKEEKVWFIKNLNFFDWFMETDKLDVLDKFLDWRSKFGEDRIALKSSIDFMPVCAELIINEEEYPLADKILKWRFPTEAEKKEFLENFEDDEIQWLDIIFADEMSNKFNVDWKRRLKKFLKWLLGNTEEIGRFKKKLVNEYILKNFLSRSLPSGNPNGFSENFFKVIDKFLAFCLPPEDVELLKMTIRDNVKRWILYLYKEDNLLGIDYFLKWLLKDDNEKERVIKEFLMWDIYAVVFFEAILGTRSISSSKNTLGSWIKNTGDIDQVESFIDTAFDLVPKTYKSADLFIKIKKIIHHLRNGPDVAFQFKLFKPSDFKRS